MPYMEGVGIPYLQLASPYDNIHTDSDIDLDSSFSNNGHVVLSEVSYFHFIIILHKWKDKINSIPDSIVHVPWEMSTTQNEKHW